MTTVFISGSISIKTLPLIVKNTIDGLIHLNANILVGDARGIDTLVQNYLRSKGYAKVTVYSIYPTPRYKVPEFAKKTVPVTTESSLERDRQVSKDEAMTKDSDYSLVIWDGKSRGSHQNIKRAISSNKKALVYLSSTNSFIELNK